jgi:hypothetical protein
MTCMLRYLLAGRDLHARDFLLHEAPQRKVHGICYGPKFSALIACMDGQILFVACRLLDLVAAPHKKETAYVQVTHQMSI